MTSFFLTKALACISILRTTAFAQQQVVETSTCVQISGGNSRPVTLQSISELGSPPLNGSYEAATPFSTAEYTVNDLKLSATCTSNGPRAAPTCASEVDLTFCSTGTTCDSSNESYRTGTFKATGTGPVAYYIEGSGTGSFEGAYGSIDSDLNLTTFNLENVQIQLCSKKINYGDNIILQSNAMDNRWLSGGRGGGNEGTDTRNALGSAYEQSVGRVYKWTVRSNAGNGNLVNVDPRHGRCVKYGDKVHLQANNLNSRWLTGGRGGGNTGVNCRDKLSSSYERTNVATTYEWIVRSAPGKGTRSFKDPRSGRCVEYGDIINLQVNNLDNRWLSGARGTGNAGVDVRDKYSSANNDYERTVAENNYSWIARSTLGDGTRS